MKTYILLKDVLGYEKGVTLEFCGFVGSYCIIMDNGEYDFGLRYSQVYIDSHPDMFMEKSEYEKLNKPMEKKIKGYLAPFDINCGIIKKGTLYLKSTHNSTMYRPFPAKNDYHDLPMEIVEKWEAVYEEEKVYTKSDLSSAWHNGKYTFSFAITCFDDYFKTLDK